MTRKRQQEGDFLVEGTALYFDYGGGYVTLYTF